jgi:hypothetical protein
VIGVGGADSLSQAESFLASAGGPPHTLWSDTYTAWNHYQAGNPILILLDGTGATQIERVSGFNASRLQDALDSVS